MLAGRILQTTAELELSGKVEGQDGHMRQRRDGVGRRVWR